MLVEAFKTHIYPHLVEIAVIMFVFSICQYGYSLFKSPNWSQFIEKLKGAIIAYAVVRGAFVIVNFIDKVIKKMGV